MIAILGGILGLFLLLALVLVISANRKKTKEKDDTRQKNVPPPDCCGAHEVCEYDQIKMDAERIEYYNDEELDAYKNIDPESFSDEQIREIREVLYTLKTEEIRYWLLSIDRRNIQLPVFLQEEARMLMAEG